MTKRQCDFCPALSIIDLNDIPFIIRVARTEIGIDNIIIDKEACSECGKVIVNLLNNIYGVENYRQMPDVNVIYPKRVK